MSHRAYGTTAPPHMARGCYIACGASAHASDLLLCTNEFVIAILEISTIFSFFVIGKMCLVFHYDYSYGYYCHNPCLRLFACIFLLEWSVAVPKIRVIHTVIKR